MLVSYNWLQSYFESPLPSPEVVADALTFHSSEIEGIEKVADDTVFDIKVLPDKSAWLLSHRGVAKELSVILGIPMKKEPFTEAPEILPVVENIAVRLQSDTCDYYSATLLENITVGPSPEWLRFRLEAVGQKSINNVVDITNYVMLSTGQPLHAFDAKTLKVGDGYMVGVRAAKTGEKFVSLTQEEYELTPNDAVITNGDDEILALAGVKGGLNSGICDGTTSIILEAAHFNRVAVRQTAGRHKLPTDASRRYENGISPTLVDYGVAMATKMLGEMAGGSVVGSQSAGRADEVRPPVKASLTRLSSVLGVDFDTKTVSSILDRFGYQYDIAGDVITVTPPFERDDIQIEADVFEEIGRIYGLDKIASVSPVKIDKVTINKRHYYAEAIRDVLVGCGFSEVYTSSFRSQDMVKMQNALASDKGYLRSSLADNLAEARDRNLPYRDLLGISAVKIFEIGTVFNQESEEFVVTLAVQTNTNYKAKIDEPLWRSAITELEKVLGVILEVKEVKPGVIEFSLDTLLPKLAEPTAYAPKVLAPIVTYEAFSNYPPVSRDIAMWVKEGAKVEEVEEALRASSGPLLVRLTHLDTFTNDEGRTSVAFRLVFQSSDHTLVEKEIVDCMDTVYEYVEKEGWEVR